MSSLAARALRGFLEPCVRRDGRTDRLCSATAEDSLQNTPAAKIRFTIAQTGIRIVFFSFCLSLNFLLLFLIFQIMHMCKKLEKKIKITI